MLRALSDSRRRLAAVFAAATVLVSGVMAEEAINASAETAAPGWEATSHMYPTHLAPGTEGAVVVEVYNIGAGFEHRQGDDG